MDSAASHCWRSQSSATTHGAEEDWWEKLLHSVAQLRRELLVKLVTSTATLRWRWRRCNKVTVESCSWKILQCCSRLKIGHCMLLLLLERWLPWLGSCWFSTLPEEVFLLWNRKREGEGSWFVFAGEHDSGVLFLVLREFRFLVECGLSIYTTLILSIFSRLL